MNETSSSSQAVWQAFRARTHFGSLDGLRALSILAVVWHHGPGARARTIWEGKGGQRGVVLFFAISGFLITTLLLREHDRNGSISLAGFYARRSLRIFPLYYAVLGIYVVLLLLSPAAGSAEFFHNLPYFLTYTSNWLFSGGIFAFAWSLASEEQFYATWPSVLKFARPKRAVWFVMLLLAASIAWTQLGTTEMRVNSWFFTVLASVQMAICWGCLVAFLLHSPKGFHIARLVLGHRPAAPIALLLMPLSLLFPQILLVGLHFTCAVLVCACVVREDSGLAPVLRWRPIAHIGLVSYGIYMLHGLVYNALDIAGPRVLRGWTPHTVSGFVLAALIATALATLSYRYFEGPFLALKSRLASRSSKPAIAPAAATD